MTHASLFSGIGGFDLAASWMGWNNAFHCEINPFCQKILKYHFPKSESYEDITKTDFRKWEGKVDVLSGGFPCQPFSVAGQRRGTEDNRYIWPQMLRAIREIKPTWVVGENVAGIITMVQPGTQVEVERSTSLFGEGYTEQEHRQQYVIETICRDLEQEGYSVQPILIPACAVGAPHRRDRIWFIANRADTGIEGVQQGWTDGVSAANDATDTDIYGLQRDLPRRIRQEARKGISVKMPAGNGTTIRITADTDSNRRWNGKDKQEQFSECEGASDSCIVCEDGFVADSDGMRNTPCQESERTERSRRRHFPQQSQRRDTPERTNGLYGLHGYASDSEGKQSERCEPEQPCNGSKEQGELRGINSQSHTAETTIPDWRNFPTQSPVCSRNDGLPGRLDGISFSAWRRESIKAYGNAIVPQVAYEIFKAIENAEGG